MNSSTTWMIATIAAMLLASACATTNGGEVEYTSESKTEIEGPKGTEYERETEIDLEDEGDEMELTKKTTVELEDDSTEYEQKTVEKRRFDKDGNEIEGSAEKRHDIEYETDESEVEAKSTAKADVEIEDDEIKLNLERKTSYDAEQKRAERSVEPGEPKRTATRESDDELLEIEVSERTEAGEMPEEPQLVHFPYDESELDASDKELLQQRAKWIKANPDKTIMIQAHADERGSNEYNLALAERRGKAVRDYLVNELDVDPERLEIVSYGEERPLIPNADTEVEYAMNRRAELVAEGTGDLARVRGMNNPRTRLDVR